MAKRGRRTNRTGRSGGQQRFFQLPFWMMETAAWLSLSPNASRVLEVLGKRYNGVNNGRIGFGVRSGVFVVVDGELVEKPFGLSRYTVGRALDELEAKGFIICTQDATFGQKRLQREWRLTWLSSGAGDQHQATKEFASWEPTKKTKARGTGAHNSLPTGALVHTGSTKVPETDSYRGTGAPMAKSHRGTGAHHLVYQGTGDRRPAEDGIAVAMADIRASVLASVPTIDPSNVVPLRRVGSDVA